MPVCVVQESPNSDRDLEQAETVLAQAIAQGVSAGIPVKPGTRLCLNAAEGILSTAREQAATIVLVGWNRAPKPSAGIFGGVLDQIVAGGRELTIVAKLSAPLPETSSIALVIPPFAERHPGYARAGFLLRRILGSMPGKLNVITLASDNAEIQESLHKVRGSVPHVTALETWKEFPNALRRLPPGTTFLFLCPRPGRPAWHPSLEQLPKAAIETFPDSTLLLLYLPDEAPEEGVSDDQNKDDRTEGRAPVKEAHEIRTLPETRTPKRREEPSDTFFQGLLRKGRVAPDLKSAAVVDAVRDLLELGFPEDRKTVHRLTGIYSEIAQKQPIELAPGILLLHAHVDNIEESLVLVGAKPSGLRLLALEEPVRLVVLLCAPSSQSPEDHLSTLSLIAQAFKDERRIGRILAAKSRDDLAE